MVLNKSNCLDGISLGILNSSSETTAAQNRRHHKICCMLMNNTDFTVQLFKIKQHDLQTENGARGYRF